MEERDEHGHYKKGTKFSDEHKRRISESRKTYIKEHPEVKIKYAERMSKTISEGKAGFATGNKLRVGTIPWNKGKKSTDDPRIHTGMPWNYKGGNYECLVCEKALGSRQPKNKLCSKCFGVSISKENHYNWKGGITVEHRAARTSQAYLKWRKAVFVRDDYTCQLCGVRGVKIQADHIKSFAEYPELRTELSNGRTLCITCHKLTPNYCRNIK